MATRRILATTAAAVSLAPSLIYCLSLCGLFPWSGVNCSTADIDLQSGRIRYTRYIFWHPIRSRIWDSALTKALRPSDLPDGPPDWHPTTTWSPGVRHSPHYHYHASLTQVRDLEMFWRFTGADQEARRVDALQVLKLWRKIGCSGAERYLMARFVPGGFASPARRRRGARTGEKGMRSSAQRTCSSLRARGGRRARASSDTQRSR